MPPLSFYLNSVDSGVSEQPNEFYRGLQQAFINAQWDNTTALITVQEQDGFGLDTYHDIEVWINKVIGITSTFMKNGEDFRQLLFREIDRKCYRGLYYIFENCYWLADFTNPSQGLSTDITVRRCNNVLKIVDPDNGSIFSIPCTVDYDLTSPTILVNSYILTPNSHAIVYVQGNKDTLRLFTLNKRFMFNGRPFKLYAYQDTLNQVYNEETPPILYMDLYLDELHAQDDRENNVAYNGDFNYTITINADDMNLLHGATGRLDATVALNGEEVARNVVWRTSDENVVTINEDGIYEVVGESGASAEISATLDGNALITSQITISVVNVVDIRPVITLNPFFNKIRQYETIETEVEIEYNGQNYIPDSVSATLADNADDYLSVEVIDNIIRFTCENFASQPQGVDIHATNSEGNLDITTHFSINCVNMFG